MHVAWIDVFWLSKQTISHRVVVVHGKAESVAEQGTIQTYIEFLALDEAQLVVATTLRVGSLDAVVGVRPSPPCTGSREDILIHKVLRNIKILVQDGITCGKTEVIEPVYILQEILFRESPAESCRWRDGIAVALRKLCRMYHIGCQVGIVLMCIVV